MLDISMTRLHEVTVIIYAISVLLYFIDFLHINRKVNQFAFWLLLIVWVLQTIFLCLYMIETGRFPVLTIFEGLYFYVWLIIGLAVFISKFMKLDFILFFTNVLGFVLMVVHAFAPSQIESRVMAQQLVSELLFIHITMAIFAYAAFTLSFIFSILYLIQYDLLKKKKWGKKLLRLGDLSKLEKLSYILNVIGIAVLFIALVLGVRWALIKLPDLNWIDTKIVGSFFIIIVYSFFIYCKQGKQLFGKNLAIINIAAFLLVLLNFFLFSSLSGFHYWNI